MIHFVQIGNCHGLKEPVSCIILVHPFHSIKLLTPNDLHMRRAVRPLNSSNYTCVANFVSKFGATLFAPIRLTAVAHDASGPLKVRLSYSSQNVPPSPPKLLHKH